MKRSLGVDPLTGVETVYEGLGDKDVSFIIHERQDVTAILNENQRQHAQTEKHTRYGDGWTKVASIPVTELGKLMKEGRLHDPAYMKRYLNDRDNRKLRTRAGTV